LIALLYYLLFKKIESFLYLIHHEAHEGHEGVKSETIFNFTDSGPESE
jgi:hypothetical protein